MADISLTLGGGDKTGSYQLLDNKTGAPVPATFSAQAVGANSNPEVATFAIDGSGNPVGTPVASGAGTVVFSAHVDYTDPGDGSAKSEDKSVSKNFAVITGPDGTSLDVVF